MLPWVNYPTHVTALYACIGAAVCTYVVRTAFRLAPILSSKVVYSLSYRCIQVVVWPFLFVIWGEVLLVVLKALLPYHPESLLLHMYTQLLWLVGTLLIATAMMRLISIFEERLLTNEERVWGDPMIVRAISKLVRIGVGLLVVLMALPVLGVNIAGIWAFGGGSAVILGISIREILANYFAGLMIYVDRAFQIGDHICVPDYKIEGRVRAIGWRITHLLLGDRTLCYVPNAMLLKGLIVNTTQAKHDMIADKITIQLSTVSVLDKVVREVRDTLQQQSQVDQQQPISVYFSAIKAGTIQLHFCVFVRKETTIPSTIVRQALLFRIIDILTHHKLTTTVVPR